MPVTPTYPGAYVEELSSGVTPIQGVSTSIAAFIGSSVCGPLNQPIRIFSLSEFQSNFGKVAPSHELGHAVKQFFANGGTDAWIVRVSDTAPDWQTGITTLASVEPFNLLVLPGVTDAPTITAAIAYCEKRSAFLLLDSPHDAITPQEILQYLNGGPLPHSENAAMYYPWVKVAGRWCAPGGTLAGVIARTDAERGVWKSPAGTMLTDVTRLKYNLTDAENALLNPVAINCLRSFPGKGIVAWGARTLAGADSNSSEWKYIPVRRLALFVERSIFTGTQWVVFEPNAEPLWARIRQSVGNFLNNLFRSGAFQGVTPKDAYYVKCDAATTTQNDVNLGIVNIEVGFAPLKPAEFIVLVIQRQAGKHGSKPSKKNHKKKKT